MNQPSPFRPGDASTLVDLLRLRAGQRPERCTYSFLPDGAREPARMSNAECERQARAIGGWLQGRGLAGERAMLLYDAGLEYIAACFGCLFAGVAAVPAYPPRFNRGWPRLRAIIADARAKVVLTTSAVRAHVARRFAGAPELAELSWLATDELESGWADEWRPARVDGETPAFLQYTSGSTGDPKGVALSHRNLLHNLSAIRRLFGNSAESRGVFWLPPYHDMGLIGAILQPLYCGGQAVLMSPASFLKHPQRWLNEITRAEATVSGGPNFAYELCVQRIDPERREALDLRSWKVAFSGAELIRAETLKRFTDAFAPCGFRPEAFYPCYGLAEVTLLAAGGEPSALPVTRAVQRDALGFGRAVAASPGSEDAQTLVGCGRSLPDQRLLIVDPEMLTECEPGEVGEIWVSGASVARGYWNRPAETEQTFGARLADTGEGPFLRTGDLGFLHEGELFVVGRLKDLIIIGGRNHHPHDIEMTVARSHPALHACGGAAFGVEKDGEERLVLVHEVGRDYRTWDAKEIVSTIRRSVAEEHQVHVHAVVLIKFGSLPKTSSGKIQRNACRSDFLANNLEAVGG